MVQPTSPGAPGSSASSSPSPQPGSKTPNGLRQNADASGSGAPPAPSPWLEMSGEANRLQTDMIPGAIGATDVDSPLQPPIASWDQAPAWDQPPSFAQSSNASMPAGPPRLAAVHNSAMRSGAGTELTLSLPISDRRNGLGGSPERQPLNGPAGRFWWDWDAKTWMPEAPAEAKLRNARSPNFKKQVSGIKVSRKKQVKKEEMKKVRKQSCLTYYIFYLLDFLLDFMGSAPDIPSSWTSTKDEKESELEADDSEDELLEDMIEKIRIDALVNTICKWPCFSKFRVVLGGMVDALNVGEFGMFDGDEKDDGEACCAESDPSSFIASPNTSPPGTGQTGSQHSQDVVVNVRSQADAEYEDRPQYLGGATRVSVRNDVDDLEALEREVDERHFKPIDGVACFTKIHVNEVATLMKAGSKAGSRSLKVSNTSGFVPGQVVVIDAGTKDEEVNKVHKKKAAGFGFRKTAMEFKWPMKKAHEEGTTVAVEDSYWECTQCKEDDGKTATVNKHGMLQCRNAACNRPRPDEVGAYDEALTETRNQVRQEYGRILLDRLRPPTCTSRRPKVGESVWHKTAGNFQSCLAGNADVAWVLRSGEAANIVEVLPGNSFRLKDPSGNESQPVHTDNFVYHESSSKRIKMGHMCKLCGRNMRPNALFCRHCNASQEIACPTPNCPNEHLEPSEECTSCHKKPNKDILQLANFAQRVFIHKQVTGLIQAELEKAPVSQGEAYDSPGGTGKVLAGSKMHEEITQNTKNTPAVLRKLAEALRQELPTRMQGNFKLDLHEANQAPDPRSALIDMVVQLKARVLHHGLRTGVLPRFLLAHGTKVAKKLAYERERLGLNAASFDHEVNLNYDDFVYAVYDVLHLVGFPRERLPRRDKLHDLFDRAVSFRFAHERGDPSLDETKFKLLLFRLLPFLRASGDEVASFQEYHRASAQAAVPWCVIHDSPEETCGDCVAERTFLAAMLDSGKGELPIKPRRPRPRFPALPLPAEPGSPPLKREAGGGKDEEIQEDENIQTEQEKHKKHELREERREKWEYQRIKNKNVTPYFIFGQSLVAALLWIYFALTEYGADWMNAEAGIDSFFPGRTTLRTHYQCNDLRDEIFRYFTYQYTHYKYSHILGNVIMNIFLGLRLNKLNGNVIMALFYWAGVFGGACIYFIWDVHITTIGMSGGCYSLFGQRYGYLIINWNQKKYALLEFLLLTTMILLDFGNWVLTQMKGDDSTSTTHVSHSAHTGGMIMGLMLVLIWGVNLDETPSEIWFKRITFVCFCLLWGFCIVFRLVSWAPWDLQRTDGYCWLQLVYNSTAFNSSDWHCVQCHEAGPDCVLAWSSPSQKWTANTTWKECSTYRNCDVYSTGKVGDCF